MNKLVIAPTTEIVAALYMQAMKSDARAKFQNDPRGCISQWTGEDMSQDISMEVVENSADTVHVSLPYYGELDGNFPSPVGEADLDKASGGWYDQLQTYLKDHDLKMEPFNRKGAFNYGDAFWARQGGPGGFAVGITHDWQWQEIMDYKSPNSAAVADK